MKIRLLKIIFSFAAAFYMTLVVLNNVTDPDANYQFVRGVFSMENIFSGETNRWRALSADGLVLMGFIFIVSLEAIIALLLWRGSFGMLRSQNASNEAYLNSKKYTTLGLGLGILLWFTLFITIGGEWFLMWQSEKWNALPTAFSLTIIFFLFLLFHQQHDHD